jgi:protein TonB
MTAIATQRQYAWDRRRSETSICWVCAAVFAGILHFVVIWTVIHWMRPVAMQDSPSAAAEAVSIPMVLELVQDLQPVAAQPQESPQEKLQEKPQEKPEEKAEEKAAPIPPETTEAKSEDKPEPVEKSEPVETAAEEPKLAEPEPVEPKPAEPEKAVAEQQPDLPRSNDKAAVPATVVKPRKVVTPKPPPPTPVRVAPTPVVKRKPVVAETRPTPRAPAPVTNQRAEREAAAAATAARAPATAAARAAAAATAAGRAAAAVASSAASSASWRASLMAHLNRYKRFPPGASPGSVSVAFTIDRSGGVRSASLARSSGNSALDAEAVAMVRRASPVPAPPAGVGGSLMAIAVPIRFSR